MRYRYYLSIIFGSFDKTTGKKIGFVHRGVTLDALSSTDTFSNEAIQVALAVEFDKLQDRHPGSEIIFHPVSHSLIQLP